MLSWKFPLHLPSCPAINAQHTSATVAAAPVTVTSIGSVTSLVSSTQGRIGCSSSLHHNLGGRSDSKPADVVDRYPHDCWKCVLVGDPVLGKCVQMLFGCARMPSLISVYANSLYSSRSITSGSIAMPAFDTATLLPQLPSCMPDT